MEWIEPKTDWNDTEYFEYTDYNRIVGNLKYLKKLGDELFANIGEITVGEQKKVMQEFYAREMNEIENSLHNLNLETYGFDIGSKKIYKANGATPLWSEFNRIENASLLLYNTMVSHKNSLPRLTIVLGGQKGIKV